MKLCKDCQHFVAHPALAFPEMHRCQLTLHLSPVDGVTLVPITLGSLIRCATKRADPNDPCGPEGKLWQAR